MRNLTKLNSAGIALFFVMTLSIYSPVVMKAQQISVPDWENPKLTSLNTIQPHVTYIIHVSKWQMEV